MKSLSKKLTAILFATMIVIGSQIMTFAAVDSSASEESSASASAVESASEQDAASTASEADASQAPVTTDGNINESPDTGIAVAPIAVALLAAACVPVIIKTRK